MSCLIAGCATFKASYDYERGRLFETGTRGSVQSYQEALKLYRSAAEQGDAKAMIALMRPEMIEAARDEEVVKLRRLSVVEGNTKTTSIDDAAAAYLRGDYAQTLKILRPLAEQGNVEAQYSIGLMYAEGQGVTQNHQEALKWFKLAAAQGYAQAQYNSGVMYRDGLGVAQNYQEALKWYRLAAAQGHAFSQYNIGAMYE